MTILGKWEDARQFYEQALNTRSNRLIFALDTDKKYEAQIQALIWCEIGRTWQFSGNSEQRRKCFNYGEETLLKADVTGGPAWAKIRFQQGNLFWHEGKYQRAQECVSEALTLFEMALQQRKHVNSSDYYTRIMHTLTGDPVDLGRVYALLGLIENTIGQSTSALMRLNAALEIYEQHNCQREIAIVCSNQGDIYLRKSEYTLAKSAFDQAINIAEKIGDIPSIVVCLGNLGILSMRLGDLQGAEVLYKRALALAEQVNDPFYISFIYGYLSIAEQEQGNTSEARKALAKSLKISRSTQNAFCLAFGLTMLGYLYLLVYNYDEKVIKDYQRNKFLKRAKFILQRALSFRELEAENRIEGQLALAEVTLLLGDLDEAHQQSFQVLQEAEACELVWLAASTRRFIGRILLASGQKAEAEEYFQQSLAIFRQTKMSLEYARTLQAYGIYLLQENSSIYIQQGYQFLEEASQEFKKCQALPEQRAAERILALQHGRRSSLTPRKDARKVR
jgi:tetratricopeptide (TPR) repeat protein